MTALQKRWTGLFLGIFLLVVTLFRVEWFAGSSFGLWIYRALAFGSLVLIATMAGRLMGKKMMWVALALLLLVEVFIALSFQAATEGKRLPDFLIKSLRYIYMFHALDYVVYDEERGRYDEQLFYTLKPGAFEYSAMEFSDSFYVNSAGFRDDEASLQFPEVVFLGDSYTMGWGARQTESFAGLLEKKFGKKALNLGIASYGTAREYLAFKNRKLDSCRLVVLQFCPNDVNENRFFVENNFHLKISPPEVFEKEVQLNKLNQVYFPLKYIHSGLSYFVKKIREPAFAGHAETVTNEGIKPQQVEDFFTIVQKIKESFDGNIVIFSLGMGYTTPAVYRQFRERLASNPIEAVYLFPAVEYLSKEDYYTLDLHLNESGNRKIAEGLKKFILEHQLLPEY